jgi:hypothetical protein
MHFCPSKLLTPLHETQFEKHHKWHQQIKLNFNNTTTTRVHGSADTALGVFNMNNIITELKYGRQPA